jgi:transposase
VKTKQQIREQIREYLEQGRTQEQIAGDLGTTQPAVSQMITRMEQAGEIAPRRRVRDPKFVAAVVKLYNGGATVAEISVALGRNLSTCYAVIRELVTVGVIAGKGSGRRCQPGHEDAVETVMEMTQAGATIAEIATAINRSDNWVVRTRATLRAQGKLAKEPGKRSNGRIDWEPKIPQIRRMIEAGHAVEAISFAIGVNVESLRRKLRELGIQSNRQKALARYRGGRSI